MTKVCVSGGFDPIHVGHIRYIKEASKYGDVIVILNSDDWLIRKKGKTFYKQWSDRYEILSAISGVYAVASVDDADGSVCEALERIKPDIFCNGGDRFSDNIPEKNLCEKMGIDMKFNVGGGKIDSSSELIMRAK